MRTIGFWWIGAGVRRSRWWCDRRDERARSWVFWVRRSRFLGSSKSVFGFGLFFLSLSLSLRVGVISLSLSSLSVFWKMIFEGKIKTEINFHPNIGQLKSIFGKCIFHAQPNTCKYGKAFSEVIFTQNKHSLNHKSDQTTS